MGILIKCEGATFDKKYVIDTVELPDPDCPHEYDNDCDAECNLCGATRIVTHNYVGGYCTVCGKKDPDKVWAIDEYPVTDTLKGLYDLGGTVEASLVNHAPNPVATGAPSISGDTHTVSEDYITFNGESKNRMMPTLPMHKLENGIVLVALFSTPTGTQTRPLISNRRAGTGARYVGMGLYSDRVEIAVEGATTAGVYNFDEPVHSNNFAILAFSGNTSGYRVVRYSNGTLTTLLEYTGSVNGWETNTFQIGGDGTGNVYPNAPAHISLAAIHEGDVTAKQLESICEFVKAYGEQKGLTIE